MDIDIIYALLVQNFDTQSFFTDRDVQSVKLKSTGLHQGWIQDLWSLELTTIWEEGHFKKKYMGWPHSLVVKFSTLHFGGLGSIPRHGPTPLGSSHIVAETHLQNRGRLVQMLAQGKSSSEKKKWY